MGQGKDVTREEVFREFLLESQENLDQFETALLRLESEPATPALLTSMFRNLHSRILSRHFEVLGSTRSTGACPHGCS
jgi:chemotaxis protein histidine kinase CheA